MLILNLFKLHKTIDLRFLRKTSQLILKGPFGLSIIKMPSYYYYTFTDNSFSFFMNHSLYFYGLLASIYSKIHFLTLIFFFRIRLRGLGFRIRRITNSLFRFFFNSVNFIYFYVPCNIIFKVKRKHLFFVSNNLDLLKKLLNQIVLLKTFGGYNVRGFLYPRQIVVLKSGKKAF